jgi:putative membrane protein
MLLPTVSLAQTSTPMSSTPMGVASAAMSAMSTQDSHFIKVAAMSGLAEVQDGQLAESNGGAAVQKLGLMMVTDHTKANDQLKAVAIRLGAPLPTAVSPHDAMVTEKLQSLHGASFDSKYLAGQKMAHEKAIALFKKEIASGSSSQLKMFATDTLPVLENHLKMIEETSSKSA